jgi:fluoride ion exporter CrcB/FEX
MLCGLFGGLGGITRAAMGLWKSLSHKRKILWQYWIMTVLISLVIGIFLGFLMSPDYKVSLLAGYAGTDILEGIVKGLNLNKK